jgi:hypothetical protein
MFSILKSEMKMKTKNFYLIKFNGDDCIYSALHESAAPMDYNTARVICEWLNGESLANALSRFSNLKNQFNISLKVD